MNLNTQCLSSSGRVTDRHLLDGPIHVYLKYNYNYNYNYNYIYRFRSCWDFEKVPQQA